jgi:hypothetical protein
VLLVAVGCGLVGATLLAAIRTFVVPRSQNVWLTRWVFVVVRGMFDVRARRASTYAQCDGVMALYAPIALLTLPVAYLALVLLALLSLLVAYLPTIYSSFSRRESAVTLLEVRAGSPPSAVEMFIR